MTAPVTLPQRRLGRSGPVVSALGLGAMGMSDFYGTAATRDDAESLATIEAAIDAGVTLVNTGDFYGMGHNERLVGRALAGARRESVTISVKFGALRTPSGGWSGFDGRPAAVKNFAAYSLDRLGVDVIDLYQPARVDPAVPLEETVGAVADLIREGKVRYLGVSEMNAAQLRRAHAVHPVTALEIEYSLATRVLEGELLDTARELGVGVVAYGALSRGLLARPTIADYAAGDFRAHLPRFTGENRARNAATVARLHELAASHGMTGAQLALAWVMSRGDDVVTLFGTTRRERLAENLGAASVTLAPELLATLDAEFGADAIAGTRYDAFGMRMVVQ
ncbi:MAG: aldo/keto reductase [Gemmatimonadaceae bacterium]|nr:aldo/keto reductase [Gemmatimonadaceae bacterium]